MNLSFRFIFIIILTTWYQPTSSFIGLAGISALAGLTSATIVISMSMKSIISGSAREFGSQPDRANGRQYYMTAEQNDVIDQFIGLRQESRVNFDSIGSLLPEAMEEPELVNFRRILGDFFSKTAIIDYHYNEIARYADEFLEHRPEYLMNTTMHLISTVGIEEHLQEVRNMLFDNPFESILQLFVQYGKEFLHKTRESQSPQQYLGQLLNHYILTEQKAFLTLSYCYHILEHVGQNEDFGATLSKRLAYDFAHNLNNSVAIFQKYMLHHSSAISTEFYQVNPQEHIKDVTYTELERVFQKYATNQRNLVTSNTLLDRIDPCHGQCQDHTKVTNVSCDTEECRYTTCKGTLYDCQYVIDTNAKICVTTNDSIRNYEYIIYGNMRRYGQNVDCPDNRLVKASNNVLCNQCLCTCADESTRSDRFFCAEEQSTNIHANYVLTGLRIRKINHTIYLQNQEGILLPNGQVQENSTRWIPIKSCPEKHIMELHWYKLRQLHLGSLKLLEANRVLTGISFASISTSYVSRITVKVTSMVFDTDTGKLVGETKISSRPHSQEEYLNKIHSLRFRMKHFPTEHLPSTEYNNTELHLNERSLPTRFRSTYNGFVKTDSEKFVKFQTSGMSDDVGQSTIPFLDIQEVAPYPPVPLSGIGVYHKAATPEDAGYVGLSVFTYDIANLLRPDLPSKFRVDDLEELFTKQLSMIGSARNDHL